MKNGNMGVSSGHQHLEFNVLLTELQPGSREGYVTPKTGRVIPLGDGKPWVVNRFHQKVMQIPPFLHEIHGILRDTVNKQAVRILLECFLVNK